MGANLTPVIVKDVLSLKHARGESFAVDANNILYEFLSLIRLRDGSPLKDSHGRITSHPSGLMFRTTRPISDYDMNLVFIFDGASSELKKEIRRRRMAKRKGRSSMRKQSRKATMQEAFSKAALTNLPTKQSTRALTIPIPRLY